uniref:Kazal-like domain-containing protein n=1 Tax=Pelusios castaneus TaxID=367368 RepID=A0A8C8S1N4_9SAUR
LSVRVWAECSPLIYIHSGFLHGSLNNEILILWFFFQFFQPVCVYYILKPICILYEHPVCGSDGRTYRNTCELCSYCREHDKDIKIVKEGAC